VARPTEEMLSLLRDSSADAVVLQRPLATNDDHGIATTLSLSAALAMATNPKPPSNTPTAAVTSADVARVAPPRGVVSMLQLLEVFGKQYFRPSISSKVQLWERSQDPLLGPLLKASGARLLAPYSLAIAEAITKWQAATETRTLSLLLDVIVAPGLTLPLLRDEMYCQVIRQLPMVLTEAARVRTWQLLHLMTGCFRSNGAADALVVAALALVRAPGQPYIREEILYAESCTARLAALNDTKVRVHPPHSLEIALLVRLGPQAVHKQKVYLPNGKATEMIISATTRCSEVVNQVVAPLGLQTGTAGTLLELRRRGQIYSATGTEYFWDAARKVDASATSMDVGIATGAAPLKEGVLWATVSKVACLNATIGEDGVADRLFHYPQEMVKHQRGFHPTTVPDAIALAALRLVIESAEVTETNVVARIPDAMKPTRSAVDWATAVGMARRALPADMSVLKAQQHALVMLSKSPMFGATVFEVEQKSVRFVPESLWLSINESGLRLTVPESKELAASYTFDQLSHWESSSNGIKIAVALDNGSTSIFLCKTPAGKRINVILNLFCELLAASRQ